MRIVLDDFDIVEVDGSGVSARRWMYWLLDDEGMVTAKQAHYI
jgi:hypothetical protein